MNNTNHENPCADDHVERLLRQRANIQELQLCLIEAREQATAYKNAHAQSKAESAKYRELSDRLRDDFREVQSERDKFRAQLRELREEAEVRTQPTRVVVYLEKDGVVVDASAPTQVLIIDSTVDDACHARTTGPTGKLTPRLVSASLELHIPEPNPELVADRIDTFMQTRCRVA